MPDLPVILGPAGPLPTPPGTLRQDLVDLVAANDPGYTANLPGSMIEDIASTDTQALVLIDGARVETINSLTPYAANEFTLNQLGQMYGIQLGQPTNTSVPVVFSGDPGYAIPNGFLISDGSQTYAVSFPGVIIQESGNSQPVTAVAVNPGQWAVPVGTVNLLVTSVPSQYTVAVNNPIAGTPGQLNPESFTSYRARVILAGQANCQSTPAMIRTALAAVPGVTQRSISIQMIDGSWLVLASGGDEYAMAYAIYNAMGDITKLTSSLNVISGITRAANGVVTTSLFHGLTTGETAIIYGSNPDNYDGTYASVTVVDDFNFQLHVDTSGFPVYVGDGVVNPNARNVMTSIIDYPDTYLVVFANPLTQNVTMTVTWNTSAVNFSQDSAIQQLATPALIDYVNALPTGQPINEFEMTSVFQLVVASVLPTPLLTRLVFAVSIDGVGVSPSSGTGIIQGDTQSLLFCSSTSVIVSRG